jgi:hypothetical protein
MESPLALLDGNRQSLPEDIQTAVVRQLQVVDTGHDTGKVVVRCVWRFTWPTNNGEDWRETLEA